jgi:uncharacterized membrane protein YgdD (TMEM256/DUF423 family)
VAEWVSAHTPRHPDTQTLIHSVTHTHIRTTHYALKGGNNVDRTFFALGCFLAGLAVIAGAFGAHALRDQLSPERLVTFELAVRYQMYHAFALIATAWAVNRWPASHAATAGWLFVAGIVIFSGTVYALAFGSPRWFGAITPIGGLSLIIGWMLLAWTAYKQTA